MRMMNQYIAIWDTILPTGKKLLSSTVQSRMKVLPIT